jgi:uncharacterized protein (DUF885 family)
MSPSDALNITPPVLFCMSSSDAPRVTLLVFLMRFSPLNRINATLLPPINLPGCPPGEVKPFFRRISAVKDILHARTVPFPCSPRLLRPNLTIKRYKEMSDNSPEHLRMLAHDYYEWQNVQFPVASSSQGLHRWDDRLTDYSPDALAIRRGHVNQLMERLDSFDINGWDRDDLVDFLLFRAQIEGDSDMDGILDSPARNPQLYVNECSNAIFSLLKKNYAPPESRVRSAISRLRAMPGLLAQAKENLGSPVRLFAKLAMGSARAMSPLFKDSLMTLAGGIPRDLRMDLVDAVDEALSALSGFSSWLEGRIQAMPEFSPMGAPAYQALLSRGLLLPLDADDLVRIARTEVARFRAQEAWLHDPSMADPDPRRSAHIPGSPQEFLQIYESRQAEVLEHLTQLRILTIPGDIGPFFIRELPAAFRPTSPGGFMNPPGLYDEDPSGFYFIPSYRPDSPNFYIRAAIEEPRPILSHEGIPGHFLQLSRARRLANEIRSHHMDMIFVEGWALYTEEMLLRTGLYREHSAGHGQVLRLGRYRAARVEVDAQLHRGRWGFEDAIRHFREEGGLDGEAAEGEAAGAATRPTQKITYTIGKWQIMDLLGRYRDSRGSAFRLGDFHDELLSFGSLPLSVIRYLMLDDRGALDAALERRAGWDGRS